MSKRNKPNLETETEPMKATTMNLNIYNAANSKNARVGKVKLNLNKSGLVSISSAACEMIGIEPGDKLILAENMDQPGAWFIAKHESGIPCRKPKNEKQRILIFSIAQATKKILADKDVRSMSFAIGTEPTEEEGTKLYPILMAA
jgi:hypothetical protein